MSYRCDTCEACCDRIGHTRQECEEPCAEAVADMESTIVDVAGDSPA